MSHDGSDDEADFQGANRKGDPSSPLRSRGVVPPVTFQPRLDGNTYSQSLERGLAILERFSPRQAMRGVTEIADELGMSRTTTHRYALTLVTLGYLEQGWGRKYFLSLGVTRLGMATMSSITLREHATSLMDELAEDCSYSISLSTLDGPEIAYVARVAGIKEPIDSPDSLLKPGARLPAYCTAMGKVLLANLPDLLQAEVLEEVALSTRESKPTISTTKLLAELENVRDDGLAVNDRELDTDVFAIAAPVRSLTGEVTAALSLSAPTSAISLDGLVNLLSPISSRQLI